MAQSSGGPPPKKKATPRLPVIYKGNQIKCTCKEPSFDGVLSILFQSTVDLHYRHVEQIVGYCCDLQNGKFYINDEIILEGDLSPSAIAKMKLMRDSVALKLLPAEYSPILIEERPERVAGSGDGEDSDDGVNYSDRAVTNPFSKEEFYHFQTEMESLHLRYHNAKQTNFQNAQGKYFFSLLTKVLTLDFRRMDSLHSTKSSGDYQPGALEITWILSYPKTRSNRDEGQSIARDQSRMADFVVWDSHENIYCIVGEIKCDDNAPVFFQSEEQMMGLFKAHQKVMLGLVCQL